MTLSNLLTGLFTGDDSNRPSPETPSSSETPSQVIYECRNCGTTLTPESMACPHCDETAVVEYPIE